MAISAYRQNIITRLQNIAQELADLDRTKLGGMANTKSQDGGTTIDHVGYRKSLLDEQRELEQRLLGADMVEDAMNGDDGPFEDITYGHI